MNSLGSIYTHIHGAQWEYVKPTFFVEGERYLGKRGVKKKKAQCCFQNLEVVNIDSSIIHSLTKSLTIQKRTKFGGMRYEKKKKTIPKR